MSQPPFQITSNILNLCTKITLILGQYEGLKARIPQPSLRRKSRIKTIQSSLAIEGNTLTEDQVTDIVNGKGVIASKKDILEVQNAIVAYEKISSYRSTSLASFLKAHKLLMKGLVEDAGVLRSQNVGVFKGDKVAHVAPKHTLVPRLMGDLFEFLKKKDDLHLLIKSSVFHYELEFIHPFSDGNGRTGRLWQTVLLTKYHPLFEFVPIESVVKDRQRNYYQSLGESDKKGDSTSFIEFMLSAVHKALEDFFIEFSPESLTVDKRLDVAKDFFQKNMFSRKEYLLFQKTISSATASRDLLHGVKQGNLEKVGEKALTKYVFKKCHSF